jgi:hypothetical protein
MGRSRLDRLTRLLRGVSVSLLGFGWVAWPGANLLASSPATLKAGELFVALALQETLVMTCAGQIEASGLDFTVDYSSEGGFSDIELRRNGTTIASTQLSFRGRNDQDQGVWQGTTHGRAEVLVIHLSDQTVKPEDSISVSHNGQWGRGQCDGYYWYSNGVTAP